MRIYQNFPEALGEIARDLKEMGIIVRPKTMQNKVVEGNPDFETYELQNYCYRVINPDPSQLKVPQPWAKQEIIARLRGGMGLSYDPDTWKLLPELWDQFKNELGVQDYLYAERFSRYQKLRKIIERIKEDPDSRQLWLNMWDDEDITYIGGERRVPCTLGYQFMVRGGKVHITYLMRSCDFATHIQSDQFFAVHMMRHVAANTGYEAGDFTHFIGSLHVYRKDVKDVF